MKIAVSATGKSLDSDMDPRFGRCNGFVLLDSDTGQTDYLDNGANRGLAQGVGTQAARMIADTGAGVLITGQMGPKAFQVLERAAIKIYRCAGGSVRDALQAMEDKTLPELGGDAVQAGPGKRGGRGVGGGGRGMGGGGARG